MAGLAEGHRRGQSPDASAHDNDFQRHELRSSDQECGNPRDFSCFISSQSQRDDLPIYLFVPTGINNERTRWIGKLASANSADHQSFRRAARCSLLFARLWLLLGCFGGRGVACELAVVYGRTPNRSAQGSRPLPLARSMTC